MGIAVLANLLRPYLAVVVGGGGLVGGPIQKFCGGYGAGPALPPRSGYLIGLR